LNQYRDAYSILNISFNDKSFLKIAIFLLKFTGDITSSIRRGGIYPPVNPRREAAGQNGSFNIKKHNPCLLLV